VPTGWPGLCGSAPADCKLQDGVERWGWAPVFVIGVRTSGVMCMRTGASKRTCGGWLGSAVADSGKIHDQEDMFSCLLEFIYQFAVVFAH